MPKLTKPSPDPLNEHGDPICGASRANVDARDKTCRNPAGMGTDHPGYGRCKWHYGATSAARRHAAKLKAGELAVEYDIEPTEALLLNLRLTTGAAMWVRNQIEHAADEPEVLIWQPVYSHWLQQSREAARYCIAAGIEKRRIDLEERQAALVNALIGRLLVKLGVDTTDPQVRAVVAGELRELETASSNSA